MSAKIDYKESVYKDLKRIGNPNAMRIVNKLEKVLSDNPNSGEPLKGKYEGLFKLRVGDYRAIYTKTKEGVLILRIRHRKHVY